MCTLQMQATALRRSSTSTCSLRTSSTRRGEPSHGGAPQQWETAFEAAHIFLRMFGSLQCIHHVEEVRGFQQVRSLQPP
jgi:hypothetical protein